jgi:hypothetical protein
LTCRAANASCWWRDSGNAGKGSLNRPIPRPVSDRLRRDLFTRRRGVRCPLGLTLACLSFGGRHGRDPSRDAEGAVERMLPLVEVVASAPAHGPRRLPLTDPGRKLDQTGPHTVVTLIRGEVGCSRPLPARASDKLRTFGPVQVEHGGSIAYTKTYQNLFLRRGVRLAVNCPCRNQEIISTLSLDRVTARRAKLKPKLA